MIKIELAIDSMMEKQPKDALASKLIFQLEKLQEDGSLTPDITFHLQQYTRDKRDEIESRTEEEMEELHKQDRVRRLSNYDLMIRKAIIDKLKGPDTRIKLSAELDPEEYEKEIRELKEDIDTIIRPTWGQDINAEIKFKQLIAKAYFSGIIKLKHIQDFVKEIMFRLNSGQSVLSVITAYGERTRGPFNSGMPLETIV